jgi:hypothetical protein
MKWMRERDLLIAQTMAFVQSVTGKKPDAEAFLAAPATGQPAVPAVSVTEIEAVLIETTSIVVEQKPAQFKPVDSKPTHAKPAQPIQIARLDPGGDIQSEIKARIAGFRAHQQRFRKEREEYCSTTMAKVRAALDEPAPSRSGK